jgi:hypothetical protein
MGRRAEVAARAVSLADAFDVYAERSSTGNLTGLG